MNNQQISPAASPDWGLRFADRLKTGEPLPLIEAPLPEQLIVPLNQSIGFSATACVQSGETVKRGQPIGSFAGNAPAAIVHAPTSGTVGSIEVRPVAGRRSAVCIEIMADGKDMPWEGYLPQENPLSLPSARLREAVTEAGIVGLGGAMFPTRIKLNPGLGVSTLILNGAECEPLINCDDALMNAEPESILMGAQIMLRILEADECIIAVKTGTMAGKHLQATIEKLADDRFKLIPVPDLYPAGGEIQLIKLLKNIEVPNNGLPWDTGIICQNVGTAAALANFFTKAEPLIRRIVTINGQGVQRPVNVRARIGTPISELIKCAGGYTPDAARLIMGGPMMGIALADDALPITKACNSLFVAAEAELATKHTEMPCIRCGECNAACPVNLSPQLLLQAGRGQDFERLEQLALPDCIECGCCDYVCPSHIPLTQQFRDAKKTRWDLGVEKRRAAVAEQRFRARTERLERNADTPEVSDIKTVSEDDLSELLHRTGMTQENDQDKNTS
ncbi:MAG: electron transport complex subunit RsxC [Gammaproteobacteria bacterium]